MTFQIRCYKREEYFKMLFQITVDILSCYYTKSWYTVILIFIYFCLCWVFIALQKFSLREGNVSTQWQFLQYSCLEKPMDGGAWWAAVHGVTKSQTRLNDFTFTFHFHALEKEMATHSSVLAWRIPGMGEPGGLPSMGSHRVGHDWRDSAAAAASQVGEGSRHAGFSCCSRQSQQLWCMNLVCCTACGIFLDQGLNLCSLHRTVDSHPLCHCYRVQAHRLRGWPRRFQASASK